MNWDLDKVRETMQGTPDTPGMVFTSDTTLMTPADKVQWEARQASKQTAEPIKSPVVAAAVSSSGGSAAKAVGKLGAGLAVLVVTTSLEKPDKRAPHGYDCPDPDDDDVRDMETAVAEGFAQKFPDSNVPWWLGMVFATTNLYLGARRARRPRIFAVDGNVSSSPPSETETRDHAEPRAVPPVSSMPPIKIHGAE